VEIPNSNSAFISLNSSISAQSTVKFGGIFCKGPLVRGETNNPCQSVRQYRLYTGSLPGGIQIQVPWAEDKKLGGSVLSNNIFCSLSSPDVFHAVTFFVIR